MSIIVKHKINPIDYDENRRIRVNQTVIYQGKYFQSKTGVNSLPTNDIDWIYLGLVEPESSNNLKIISKADGNLHQQLIENGDIVCGLLNDGITFIPFGKYLGGDTQDINNYNTSPMDFS